MSLFGTTPPDESPSMHSSFARSRQSLFDEEESMTQSQSESTLPTQSGSLFQDDGGSGSPWDMPAPRKKHSRADLLRNLLPAADVPVSYIETFDGVVRDDGAGGKVSSAGVTRVLGAAGLDADAQAKITSIIAPGGESGAEVALGRNEFNVLLGLVGLAQEGETISLDGIDERRRSECCLSQVFCSGVHTPRVCRLYPAYIICNRLYRTVGPLSVLYLLSTSANLWVLSCLGRPLCWQLVKPLSICIEAQELLWGR